MAEGNLRETNDPDEILKRPLPAILARLEEDASKLYALSEVDKEVLRRLAQGKDSLEPEQKERLEEALRDMRSLAGSASSARRAIERLHSGE